MDESLHLHRNHLLASIMASGCDGLHPHLELVQMGYGDVLCEAGNKWCHVYFPTTAIVSLLCVMEDGASDEISAVGNEGMIGMPLLMGCDTTPSRAVVRTAGYAYRLKGHLLQQEFHRSGAIQQLLLRYAQALLMQTAQSAVCNRHHSIDQQLSRWLLSSLDRSSSNELCITHESIASMLGVRREGVTKAAGGLQTAGLIHNDRGRITVMNRSKLEARACECYHAVKKEFDRLLLAGATGSVQPNGRAVSRPRDLPHVVARVRPHVPVTPRVVPRITRLNGVAISGA